MKNFLLTFYLLAVTLIPRALFAEENKFVSEYSSLERCKDLEIKNVSNATQFDQQCQSHGGYSVFIQDLHVRTLIVLKKGAKEIPVPADGQKSMPSDGKLWRPGVAGKQLEWRYQLKDGRKNLVALIYRMEGDEAEAYPAKGENIPVSLLYIARITEQGACIVGHAKTNEEARKIADSNSSCKN